MTKWFNLHSDSFSKWCFLRWPMLKLIDFEVTQFAKWPIIEIICFSRWLIFKVIDYEVTYFVKTHIPSDWFSKWPNFRCDYSKNKCVDYKAEVIDWYKFENHTVDHGWLRMKPWKNKVLILDLWRCTVKIFTIRKYFPARKFYQSA